MILRTVVGSITQVKVPPCIYNFCSYHVNAFSLFMNFGRKICQNDVEFLVTYKSLLWNKISGFQITKIEMLLLRKLQQRSVAEPLRILLS